MSLRYSASLPVIFKRRVSLVRHVNVLTVCFGFCLIHWLDEVSSVISLHVTSLHARGVSRVADNNIAIGNKISMHYLQRDVYRPL